MASWTSLSSENVVQWKFQVQFPYKLPPVLQFSVHLHYSPWFVSLNLFQHKTWAHPKTAGMTDEQVMVGSRLRHLPLRPAAESRRWVFLLKNLPNSRNADFCSDLRLLGELWEAEEAMRQVLHHRQTHGLAHVSQFLGKHHRVVQQGVQSRGLCGHTEESGDIVSLENSWVINLK